MKSMMPSTTAKVMLVILAASVVGGVQANSYADATTNTSTSAPATNSVVATYPEFSRLCKVFIDSRTDKAERDRLIASVKKIDVQLLVLSKKNTSGPDDIDAIESTASLLTAFAKEVGICPIVGLAMDTGNDDYARQAAWRTVEEYKFILEDLPSLCHLFRHVSKMRDEPPPGLTSRVLILPRRLQVVLALKIGGLCGVYESVVTKQEGDVSVRAMVKDPELWLKKVLQQGLALSKDKQTASIIGGCLLIETK